MKVWFGVSTCDNMTLDAGRSDTSVIIINSSTTCVLTDCSSTILTLCSESTRHCLRQTVLKKTYVSLADVSRTTFHRS